MSVYQGFATRQMETGYFRVVDRFIRLLQARCLSALYDFTMPEEQWAHEVNKVYKAMQQFD